ncbi:hypothetical protein O181_048803 [Austropuccinia psidii MF-1]|uniref:Reverse transcriptase domain-containing protein n=1 Tax=Austropuccinia psidii MF-1 TaxID=1389203 RepID=A0A9Q3DWC8_9BASI|nr:hypothetical protein [Austropuccinia psidii MF-1]
MTDLSHQDNSQVLMKEAYQLKECPTFTGEGEYDHRWYFGIRQTNGENSWSWWKNEILTKWANDSWRYKIENAFENSFLDPNKDKPSTWFLKQAEILNALYPEMSRKMMHMNMLKKCGGELEHSLRSRCTKPCSTEEYINALEDIVTRTKIGRPWKKVDIKSPNKPFIKKDKPREPFKPNTPNSNEKRKCHKCGESLGTIIGHEVDIILNVENPYPPLLRRPAYPASPRDKEALEVLIKELMDLEVLRKVGHNEQVEVTTPVIITWNNRASRMVGDFRALNTYTIPDRYPIPRIHETLTQLSQAKLITAMDSLKGFHKNVLTDNAKKQLRIIVHCGIYEYLRMPFGIEMHLPIIKG